MSTTAQQIFKKIVVHNKLMNQATVDQLLGQMPDPEVAVKFLVKTEKLAANKATQLLALYHKQLEKHGGDSGQPLAAAAPPPSKPVTDPFDDLIDQVVSGEPAVAETATTPAVETVETAPQEPEPAPALAPIPAPEPEADYGGPARIKIDLGDDGEEEQGGAEEEDLPLLELDTDPDDTQPAVPSAPAKASAPAAAKPTAASAAIKAAMKVNPKDKEVVHNILRAARKLGASDVHITAGLVPIARVAGRLQEMDADVLPAAQTQASLLAMVDEQRRAVFLQQHDLDFCYDGGKDLGRFRTNYLMEQSGMDAVFRLIDTEVPSFEELGLPEQIKRFTEYAVGIVLITGPKGCGKTTTLAAMVDMLNANRSEHIILIEDPIEFVHHNKKAHINQREVGTHTKSFGNALRAALREAPDIIVVGEMRDLETTSLAISAAETGHLVLATLHTPDAIRTIGRVLDVFPPKEQGQIRAMLSESLRGVVSQALVPSHDDKSLELAVEILVNTPAIGNMIREDRTYQLRGMIQTGRKLGMTLLDDSLIKLAKDGRIKKEDAVSRATEKEYVAKELGVQLE